MLHWLIAGGVVGTGIAIAVTSKKSPSSPKPSAPGVAAGTVLKIGNRGPAVADLQEALGAVGVYDGEIDGQFGPITDSAVRTFQRTNGLTPDGIAGPATWDALGINVQIA